MVELVPSFSFKTDEKIQILRISQSTGARLKTHCGKHGLFLGASADIIITEYLDAQDDFDTAA